MVRVKTRPLVLFLLIASCLGTIYFLSIKSHPPSKGASKIRAAQNIKFFHEDIKEEREKRETDEELRQRLLKERAYEIIERDLAAHYDSRNDVVKQEEDVDSKGAVDVQEDNDKNNVFQVKPVKDDSLHNVKQNMANDGDDPDILDLIGNEATVNPTPDKRFDGESRLQKRETNTQPKASLSWITDKNHIHDCITGDVIGKVPQDLVSMPFKVQLEAQVASEDSEKRLKSFQGVFKERAWGHDWDPSYKGLNASGMGATLNWAQEMIATLHTVINQIKQLTGRSKITLLDVPCGDMAWMQRFLKTRDDILYTGMDIVPELIDSHKKTFGQYTQWQFVQRDVLTVGIGQYDLILSRMMMQHLYNADVVRLLQKFSQSKSTYVLMTTFAGYDKNLELDMHSNLENPGRFRTLNLELSPFMLTPPLCLQRDGPIDVYQGWDHFIGLWELPLKRIQTCDKEHLLSWKHSRHKLYSCVKWTDEM